MFLANQKSTGTCYTTTVTLLVMALVFCPALLALARPIGTFAAYLLASASVLCLGLAWLSWKRYSSLTLPTLAE